MSRSQKEKDESSFFFQKFFSKRIKEQNQEIDYNRIKEYFDFVESVEFDYVSDKVQNPIKYMLSSAKTRAKRAGIPFSLTEKDIKIPERCPFFNIPITFNYGVGRCDSNPSIDRIDSKKGYTPDNIQIISVLANRMKLDSIESELVRFAKGVLSMHTKKIRFSGTRR